MWYPTIPDILYVYARLLSSREESSGDEAATGGNARSGSTSQDEVEASGQSTSDRLSSQLRRARGYIRDEKALAVVVLSVQRAVVNGEASDDPSAEDLAQGRPPERDEERRGITGSPASESREQRSDRENAPPRDAPPRDAPPRDAPPRDAPPGSVSKNRCARLIAVLGQATSSELPFDLGNEQLALHLMHAFATRNGYHLDATEHSAHRLLLRMASQKVTVDEIASWLYSRMDPIPDGHPTSTTLHALDALAEEVEDLEQLPGFHIHADRLRSLGDTLTRQFARTVPLPEEGAWAERFPSFAAEWGHLIES